MGLSPSKTRLPSTPPSRQNTDLEASAIGHHTRFVACANGSSHGYRERYGSLSGQAYLDLQAKQRADLVAIETAKLDQEVAQLQQKYAEKLGKYRDAIQPHTDEGGDAYYIGDAYREINPVFAQEWEVEKPAPYLQYVKQLGKTWKHLNYLGHWMEVTCAPPKWKFLRTSEDHASRGERARRTKVCVIDYSDSRLFASRQYHRAADLKAALERDSTVEHGRRHARLIIVEDLSRDVVETLGARFDVDPLFFASHIGDYLFHNTRDRWVELPNLDVDAREMSHFCLQYLRARYFETEADFNEAEFQSGQFNVLRRIDSDRSRKRLQNSLLDLPDASVALSRAKTSLWVQPSEPGAPITAILLVDPTVSTARSHPLWGGYRPFSATPSMQKWQEKCDQEFEVPTQYNLFEDIVHWSENMSPKDLESVYHDPRCIAISMFKIVVADWLIVLKYMTTMLGKMEWEFEKPHWGGDPTDIDKLLKKLSPWRRNVGYYQTMIGEAIARLFPPEIRATLHSSHASQETTMSLPEEATYPHRVNGDRGIRSLWVDYQNVKHQMDEIRTRIKRIEQTITNAINTEESRRAVVESQRSYKQNKDLARLTFLATIFIPLNFTSSFLSISPDFASASLSIWLFFVIGIPLTILSFLFVDLTHPTGNGILMRKWRKLRGRPERIPEASRATSSTARPGGAMTTALPASEVDPLDGSKPSLRRIVTIPWPVRKNTANYGRA